MPLRTARFEASLGHQVVEEGKKCHPTEEKECPGTDGEGGLEVDVGKAAFAWKSRCQKPRRPTEIGDQERRGQQDQRNAI